MVRKKKEHGGGSLNHNERNKSAVDHTRFAVVTFFDSFGRVIVGV